MRTEQWTIKATSSLTAIIELHRVCLCISISEGFLERLASRRMHGDAQYNGLEKGGLCPQRLPWGQP